MGQIKTLSTESLILEASRCVACGLCLPQCPTYLKTQSEADSPRGRLMLMKGVLEQRIPINERFIAHIDGCLTCRACENVCPNHVSYEPIVNSMRAIISPTRNSLINRIGRFMMSQLIAKPYRLEWLHGLLRFYQISGLQRLLRQCSFLNYFKIGRIEKYLPIIPLHKGWRREYSPERENRGSVGLFLGCVARLFDIETVKSAIFVLNRLGYTVVLPENQTCCGALHLHSGYSQDVDKLALQNVSAFEKIKVDAIISTASGCGTTLAEYQSGKNERVFSTKVQDISTFLVNVDWSEVRLNSLSAKVVIQDPCTLRNVTKKFDAPYRLLKKIPGINVEPLRNNHICCGAAGTYFLTQSDMSQKLMLDKINDIQKAAPLFVATSNVGCAMHLRVGLQEIGSNIEVLHPVTLIARQMGFNHSNH